tara:strand:+ start:4625 stop:5686 length:1062 start_codon:yes stop_codon:yes gene_type:complete
MTFFNKKEEVLDVKLTPHGRYLLSIGKLNPSYYCFVDDDIIYDSQAGGFIEQQNDTNKRIMDDTPKMKTIPARYGIDTNYKKLESENVDLESMRKTNNERKLDIYPDKLGRSSYTTKRTPSIHVNALAGEITEISHYYTGSIDSKSADTQKAYISQPLQIPQISFEPEYNISVEKLSFGEEPPWEFSVGDGLEDDDSDQYSDLFADSTYFKVTTTNPLIHFKEFNSFDHKENFMIEVYEVEDDGRIPVHKPLKFRRQVGPKIINDILIEEEISPTAPEHYTESDGVIESQYVDYYFSIMIDKDIPPEDLCKYIFKAKDKNIYIDDDIECPDQTIERFDIYGTRVGPDDIERCD